MKLLYELIFILVIAFYIGCNIYVNFNMSAKDMYEEFVVDQNTTGKIFANVYYAPAWILKFIKGCVNKIIK